MARWTSPWSVARKRAYDAWRNCCCACCYRKEADDSSRSLDEFSAVFLGEPGSNQAERCLRPRFLIWFVYWKGSHVGILFAYGPCPGFWVRQFGEARQIPLVQRQADAGTTEDGWKMVATRPFLLKDRSKHVGVMWCYMTCFVGVHLLSQGGPQTCLAFIHELMLGPVVLCELHI